MNNPVFENALAEIRKAFAAIEAEVSRLAADQLKHGHLKAVLAEVEAEIRAKTDAHAAALRTIKAAEKARAFIESLPG